MLSRTFEEVRRKLVAAQRSIEAGVRPGPERLKVGTYLDEWLEQARMRVRPRTWQRYEQYVRLHAKPSLGRVTLAKLTPEHLTRLYRERLDAGLTPTTVVHLHRMLHSALKTAVRRGLVARNVAELVDPSRAQRREMRTFSASEVRRFRDAAAGDRLEALFVLAVTTGMRQGELLGLRWKDINLDRGYLTVRVALQRLPNNDLVLAETKTDSSRRQVQLSQAAVETLRKHKARQAEERLRLGAAWEDQDIVFANEVGRPLNPSNVTTRHYHPILAKAGLPRLRFHDLRHTAATLLLEANINPRVVSEVLGHTDVGITMNLYQHVSPTMQQQAADAFDALLSTS
jgi:integrase